MNRYINIHVFRLVAAVLRAICYVIDVMYAEFSLPLRIAADVFLHTRLERLYIFRARIIVC